MAHLATELLRIVTRAFYAPEYAIIIDAIIFHSTLKDRDLAELISLTTKPTRKLCGKLREDGLLMVGQLPERRVGELNYVGPNGKERQTMKDHYYINYHRAIDSIKYRMHKLTKHVESLGLPTTEKKDLSCPRCKSQYTELEAMDGIDPATGQFLCHRCQHPLDAMEEEERTNENESMKRLNQQLDKIISLLQQIDAASVPENTFEDALEKTKAIKRTDSNPGAKTETLQLPSKNVKSTKGIDVQPEKVVVHVQNEEDIKKENAAAEIAAKKAKELAQNALPEWIANSTIQIGEKTRVGAIEEQASREREAHLGTTKAEEPEEKKPDTANDEVYEQYLKALEEEKAEEARKLRDAEDEDDDEEEEDEFEDIVPGGSNNAANNVNGKAAVSTGMSTPMGESSNATDDERETKRVKIEPGTSSALANGTNGSNDKPAADTPAASDEDDEEDEFQDIA